MKNVANKAPFVQYPKLVEMLSSVEALFKDIENVPSAIAEACTRVPVRVGRCAVVAARTTSAPNKVTYLIKCGSSAVAIGSIHSYGNVKGVAVRLTCLFLVRYCRCFKDHAVPFLPIRGCERYIGCVLFPGCPKQV